MITNKVEPKNIKVEIALISGETPNRTFENIRTGNVVEPGPAIKKVITKSSNDNVKANKAPETIPGANNGRVTRLKVSHGFAPKSAAASSNESSMSVNRARTTIATKGNIKGNMGYQNCVSARRNP